MVDVSIEIGGTADARLASPPMTKDRRQRHKARYRKTVAEPRPPEQTTVEQENYVATAADIHSNTNKRR